jgi:hypothetical protein
MQEKHLLRTQSDSIWLQSLFDFSHPSSPMSSTPRSFSTITKEEKCNIYKLFACLCTLIIFALISSTSLASLNLILQADMLTLLLTFLFYFVYPIPLFEFLVFILPQSLSPIKIIIQLLFWAQSTLSPGIWIIFIVRMSLSKLFTLGYVSLTKTLTRTYCLGNNFFLLGLEIGVHIRELNLQLQRLCCNF